MSIQRAVFILMCWLVSLPAYTQKLAIGQWKSHLSYESAYAVTQSDNTVFVSSGQGVFTLDKTDGTIGLLNRIHGLSGANIGVVRFNAYLDALVVGYDDGNLDVIYSNGQVLNLSDIQRANVLNDKAIYHIECTESQMFVSCGFGLVVYDIGKMEVRYTVFTPSKVHGLARYNDRLYMATEKGVYSIIANQQEFVLANINSWQLEGLTVGSYTSTVVCNAFGRLYANANETLYYLDDTGIWTSLFTMQNIAYRHCSFNNNRLLFTLDFTNQNSDVFAVNSDNTVNELYKTTDGEAYQAIEDETGTLWVADLYYSLRKFVPNQAEQRIHPSGPYSNNVSELAFYNDSTYMVHNYIRTRWQYTFSPEGLSWYNGTNWKWTFLKNPDESIIRDNVSLATNNPTKQIAVGSFNNGLTLFQNNQQSIYRPDNSALQYAIGDAASCRISALTYDAQNNLWMSNFGAANPIVLRTSGGQWASFDTPFNTSEHGQIAIDALNQLWIADRNAGIIVYAPGDNLLNTADDKIKLLNTSNTVLKSASIQCLAADLNGDVWVGTAQGLYVFPCIGQVFDEGCPGERPVAEEGGIAENLFNEQAINCIAVDGANRKWVGTKAGLFVITSDGREGIYHYDMTNSPLFSNNVLYIAIRPSDGEAFIGTDKGLLSVRSEATTAGNTFGKVQAYPNPIRPDYSGTIAISGLVRDAQVKITDIAGTLVHETIALGGQAIWNGEDYTGRRIQSGVYLVFITNDDGTQTLVSKLLFIH